MSLGTNFSRGLKLDPQTSDALSHFAQRRRRLLLIRSFAGGIASLILAMAFVAICDYLFLLSDGIRWALSLAGYSAVLATLWFLGLRRMGNSDPRAMARKLESADPLFRHNLLSAVELADPNEANGSVSFRSKLQQDVGRQSAGLDFGKTLPVGLIKRWLLAAAMMVVVFTTLFMVPQLQFARRMARAMLPMMAIERASATNIDILKPSPPSGFVAEGDAVGIVVQISGKPTDEVLLQWITADDVTGETSMTPRVSSQQSTQDGTLENQGTFAANLSIGTIPVRYRIRAGDGVTLWHELTPLPRPGVQSFEKKYQFPAYTKLPERIETAEHGDIKALSGSKVELTLSFDEPVENAKIGFGEHGLTPWQLTAVDGSDRVFSTTIPVSSASNYQIDATSLRSGLNNPFSPQYSVTPVMDAPPAVRWDRAIPKTLLAAPIDVLPMLVLASDDLPLDEVIQEYKVNDGPLIRRQIAIEAPNRDLQLRWDWDLMKLGGEGEPPVQLSGGDIIQTRTVAIDRKGQTGESDFIQILVAEPGFDRARHDHLIPMRLLTEAITTWADQVSEIMDLASDSKQDDVEKIANRIPELHAQNQSVIQLIKQQIESSGKSIQSSEWELLGRSVSKTDRQLERWISEKTWIRSQTDNNWKTEQERATRDLTNRAKRIGQDVLRIKRYSQALFGKSVSIGLIEDTMALQENIQQLTQADVPNAEITLPRQMKVAAGRLEALEQLFQMHREFLPDSTQSHLDNWSNWVDGWASRLQASIDAPPSKEASLALLGNFESELKNQQRASIYDSRLTAALSDMLRELQIQVSSSGDAVRRLLLSGQSTEAAKRKLETSENDSNASAAAAKTVAHTTLKFDRDRQAILQRLDQDESLHRSRLNLDPQYAADLNLMHRAIENVTENGFQPYRDENPTAIHQKLGYAFQTLESYHAAVGYLDDLRQLMLAERKLENNATSKIDHPHQIDRIAVGMEWPVSTMVNARLKPEEETRKLGVLRYGKQINAAKERISSRRWKDEPMISAEADLADMEREFDSAITALLPGVEEARETVRQYVLTLPEQAREAAEKVKKAQERTETRQDSSQQTAQQLAEEQEDANEATRETLEALIDFANTASITDDAERELARDADAATAQIQDAVDRAEDAMEKAQAAPNEESRQQALDETAQSLEQLADALEQTAAHFEAAESGESIEQSREDLRQAEAAIEMQNELDQRFEDAQQMAEAAQSTPEELMEQLERELQTNQPMRQELSEIAQEAAESAQRELEDAAEKEKDLNQALESSDPTLKEQKKRTAEQIENLASRTETLERALVEKAETALSKDQGNAPKAQEKLQEAKAELREAIDAAANVNGGDSLLSEMQEAAQKMSEAIENAQQAIADAKQPTDNAVQQEVHKDDASRNRSKQQLEASARDARSQQARNAISERQQWSAAKHEADRRANDARNQKRTAENRKRQLEQQLNRPNANQDQIKEAIQEAQEQIENAASAEQAARQTKEFAEQNEKAAGEREQKARNQQLPPLDKPNPAAELASRLNEQAQNELGDIREALSQLNQDMANEDQLRVPEEMAERLAEKQNKIQQQVDNATEQLRRAARHEERLGQSELAEQLAQAAENIQQSASRAAENAAKSLQDAAESAEKSPQANRDVASTSEQISQAAEQLENLLADSQQNQANSNSQQTSQEGSQQNSAQSGQESTDPESQQSSDQQASDQQASDQQSSNQQSSNQQSSNQQSSNQQSSGQTPEGQQSPNSPQGDLSTEQMEGQELARTLDELDRAMAQQAQASQQGQEQAGQQAGDQQQGQQQAGDQQQGQQPSGEQQAGQQDGQPSGNQQTAGEASPTLANAMQSQAQQAARERQSQMTPGEPSSSEGSTPSTESGSGMQMPDGGTVDISKTERAGTEWGKLRERRTEDASESRGESIAPQYRREIEAYFRAIATRAAEKSE